MTNHETPAIHYLQERKIPFSIFQHQNPVNSLEQAAGERKQRPQQVVRSIVFRLAEGEYIMVLMPGPGQVPWKALRHYVNQSRISMATLDELLQATGYRPGTVNPFGLPQPMRVLVDQGVLDQPIVSTGSGQPGLAILIKPEDMLTALDQVEVVNFSSADDAG